MTPTCPCIPGSSHPPWPRSSVIVAMTLHIYCPPTPTPLSLVPRNPRHHPDALHSCLPWRHKLGVPGVQFLEPESDGRGGPWGPRFRVHGRSWSGKRLLGDKWQEGEISGGRGNGKRIFGKKVWFVGKTVGLMTSCHGDGPPVGANVYPLERSIFRGPVLTPCLPETTWFRRHCLYSTQRSEIGSKFRVVFFSVLPLDGNTGYNLT